MFGKRSVPKALYDADALEPVILKSICTGEQTLGFRERKTGKFRAVMLLHTPKDLLEFRKKYGVEGDIKMIY